MTLSQEIYSVLTEHCGGEEKVLGTNATTLRLMKEGKVNPNTKTLGKIFKLNGVPAYITITVKSDGRQTNKKLAL